MSVALDTQLCTYSHVLYGVGSDIEKPTHWGWAQILCLLFLLLFNYTALKHQKLPTHKTQYCRRKYQRCHLSCRVPTSGTAKILSLFTILLRRINTFPISSRALVGKLCVLGFFWGGRNRLQSCTVLWN